MSGQAVLSPAVPALSSARLVAMLGLALSLAYAIILGGAYLQGNFWVDAQDRPIANDFVDVWAAGRLARDGRPAAAYDWPVHKAAEARAVGHAFANYYGWHYPPTFLLVAAALAGLPYLAAAFVWLSATLAACAVALAGILGARAGMAMAIGFPAALWNVTAGQNGFLTAALIAGTLGLLERRPALAGLCLGLLSYKPQFGLLFPIVLIADRRWLTVIVAALVMVGLAVLSWLAFGAAPWLAFIDWLPVTGRVVLGEGAADWGRLQSVFGLLRAQGAGQPLAWAVQIASALALALGLGLMWRSRQPFELKAAALAAGTLLATPYVYMYDMVVLGVAAAFLLRHSLARDAAVVEIAGLGCTGALIFAFPYLKTQVGLGAVLIVLVLIIRRAWSGSRTHAKASAAPHYGGGLAAERLPRMPIAKISGRRRRSPM